MADRPSDPPADRASPPGPTPNPLAERPFPNAPLRSSERTVPPEWIDYNGHMNIGYYGLAFDRALDDVYDDWLDMGAAYVAREGMGPFALQEQIHFLQEIRQGQRFHTEVLLLDCDHKRMHFISSMIASPPEGEAGEPFLAATAEQLSMNVSHETRRSAPYPERAQVRLEALMAAHRGLPRPPQVGAPLGIRRR
ncbi:MAG: thioesterase family protein [Pseudomonadota bacterium]